MADPGIPDDLGPELNAQAEEYATLSDLAAAQRIVARGSSVDRATWTRAQQTALWLLEHGEGGDQVRELIDIEPVEPGQPVVLDGDNDFAAFVRPYGWVSGSC